MILYGDAHWISPYVFSCVVALEEKGLEYARRPVSLHDGEHERPPYRDRAITGRVPALEHEGFWLSESSAIIEYLEDLFPQRAALLPRDPRSRARARQLQAWLRTDLAAIREERPSHSIFYTPVTRPLSSAGEAAVAKLLRVATSLLPGGATSLLGDWSIADAELAFMLRRLMTDPMALPDALVRFVEAQWRRPSVERFLTLARPAAYTPRA